ncbi:MAG: metallophosphoesterase family protein [Bacteroidaceae bacterium]|nr:metallophosphoesterase family protein [Bacteroidaceae bacterium]
MKRIGLLSDTHGYWDAKYEKYFAECDEIWHAGDIGTMEVADRLAAIAPLRAVYGNIDGGDLRYRFSEKNRFKCEDVDVLIKHIGGYPGKYDASIRGTMYTNPPKLFIAGHSHLLKVVYDRTIGCLHINPGAAGQSGFHQVRTLVRFTIDGAEIKDLEVIELGDRVSGVAMAQLRP